MIPVYAHTEVTAYEPSTLLSAVTSTTDVEAATSTTNFASC